MQKTTEIFNRLCHKILNRKDNGGEQKKIERGVHSCQI